MLVFIKLYKYKLYSFLFKKEGILMIIQNVKGGYDFLPKEQKIRNYINTILKDTFESFGYNQVETTILCYYDMLRDRKSVV